MYEPTIGFTKFIGRAFLGTWITFLLATEAEI